MSGRAEAHQLWTGLKAEHERYTQAVAYIPTDQLRLQEDLRRYLCLRCAGFLEQVTFAVLDGYLEDKASDPVLHFARSHFRYAPNLRYGPFVNLIERFGEAYRERFEQFVAVERRVEVLTDLLEVRNDIAHGKYFGGRKLDPARYMLLCEDTYDWLLDEFCRQDLN